MPRRRPWKAVAIGGAVLSALGIAVLASRKKPALPTAQRVALIGDSYAVGLGPELAKLIPDFKFEGHVGTNTTQWATHAAACGACGDSITKYKPDVVLVSLGVNDGSTPNAANYQTIVRGLHGLGARVVWIEPPAAVQTASRSVIASLGVPVVPATTTPLAGDKLHPAAGGYKTWAQEVAAAIPPGKDG